MQQFSGGFWTLYGSKTNGKPQLDLIQMDWKFEGSKQQNKFVPRQNIAFSSRRRLIQMSATDK